MCVQEITVFYRHQTIQQDSNSRSKLNVTKNSNIMVQKDDQAINITFEILNKKDETFVKKIESIANSKAQTLKEILLAANAFTSSYMDSKKMTMQSDPIVDIVLPWSKTVTMNLDSCKADELEKTLEDVCPKLGNNILIRIYIRNKETENYEPQLDKFYPETISDQKRSVFNTDVRDFEVSESKEKKIDSIGADRFLTMKYPFDRPKLNYVGLVNQAMTCYLNSLLQALYMTPEFRNALYKWEYKSSESSEPEKSIPYQLQKLFLNLQTSTKRAVETTSLTKSFGWDFNEAWQQHDIQELCRVMFDALEQNFKNTEQADLINRLYEGKINDYVKCLTCNTEKSREDTFLDIPLPVRPFDNNEAHGSVEEALEAFVKHETLEGNNQYFCEKCDKKSNAHKGLKFTKFPYILTLQLKRFDFDPKAYNRIKLNDKVTFPDILNLNSFIESISNQESPSREEDAGMSIKCDDSTTDCTVDEESSSDIGNLNSNHLFNHDQDDDEGIDMTNGMSSSSSSNHNIEKLREEYAAVKGPYIYDLFSIMIHSGSANGGHYYAYIKDFRTDKWLCFNDQTVTPIGHEEIQKTYGGDNKGYFPGMYRSSTNAYMLMYRQIDAQRNTLPMETEELPPHIKDLLQKIYSEKKTEETRSYSDDYASWNNQFQKKIYYHHPGVQTVREIIVKISLNDTLAEVTKTAYNEAAISRIADLDQCRIVSYNSKYNLICGTYDGRDDEKLRNIFPTSRSFKEYRDMTFQPLLAKDLMLDIREKSQPFENYPFKLIVTKVYLIDASTHKLLDGPKYVRAYNNESIKEYKKDLEREFKLYSNDLQLLICNMQSFDILEDDFLFCASYTELKTPIKIVAAEVTNKRMQEKFRQSALKIFHHIDDVVSFYLCHNVAGEMEKQNIPSLKSYNNDKENLMHYDYIKDDMMNLKIVNSDKSNCHNKSVNQTFYDIVMENEKITPIVEISEKEEWNTQETSNSEDSSLSDSDRTLVGEEPEDSEQDCESVPSNFLKHFSQIEKHKFEGDNDKENYFKIVESCKANMYKVTMVGISSQKELKEKLEQYLNISKKYFKIVKNGEDEPPEYLQEDAIYSIVFGRIVSEDEIKLDIYRLSMESPECLQKLLTKIVKKGEPSKSVKANIFAEVQQTNRDLSYEKCHFLIFNSDKCSKLLPYTDENMNLMSTNTKAVCIYMLSDEIRFCEDPKSLVYIRKYNRSKQQLENPQAINVDKTNFEEELKEKISSVSSIPVDSLTFYSLDVTRDNFTSEPIESLKIESFEWSSDIRADALLNPYTYLLYRDDKERVKKASRNMKPMSNTTHRKAKELKITCSK